VVQERFWKDLDDVWYDNYGSDDSPANHGDDDNVLTLEQCVEELEKKDAKQTIECTMTYRSGCANWNHVNLHKYRPGGTAYTIEECYTLCQNTRSCVGFSIDQNNVCVTKKTGCQKDNNRNVKYYSMSTCT